MEVAGKSNEELEVALVLVSAVSAYLLTMHTKLLETNAAVAAELQRVGAVAHAARRVVEPSKEARRRRKHIALPQQDQDLGRRRGHEAKREKRSPYTASAKLCAMTVRVFALTLGSLPTTSAQNFTIPDDERVYGCAFIMMMSTIICTVVIMRLVSGITNSICAMTATRCFFKGTQRDAIDDVIGPQPTVTLWVAPASGQRYHLNKECG
jgi:hypothetical protein